MTGNKLGTQRVSFQQEQKLSQDPDQKSWLSRSRKNQPQWKALGAGSVIFISGGMSLAWGAGFASNSIHLDLLTLTVHMQICWYAAALLGAILSAALTHRTPQRPVYVFSSCLVVICGVLFLTMPLQSNAIIAARYLDGFANGLIFVPTMTSISEVSVWEMRGVLAAAVEQLSHNFGILILIIYTAIWQSDWSVNILPDQFHGLLDILFGVVALAMALTWCIESPVFLLRRRNEQAAVVALRHLQRPYVVTSETFLLLDEHKRYVAANRDLSWTQSIQRSLVPLLKVSTYRALYALSLTPIVWRALFVAGVQTSPHFHTWPYVVFGILRWSGCICVVFLMDTVGRKKPTLFGTFAGGVFAISFALFCAGVAHAASSVYLTEAFPLAVKPYFVGITYAIELLIGISFGRYVPTTAGISIYFYTFGATSLSFFLLGIFCLPETRLTTPMTAHLKIRKWFNEDF